MHKASVPVAENLNHAGQIVISPQFCGPPGSGNGGYVCGRLAQFIEGSAIVRLMVPPPLNTPLDVVRVGKEVELRDGETVIGRAWPGKPDIEIPAAPGLEAARNRRNLFAGHKHHAFPGCFVCGTHRREGDGLLIFAGPENAISDSGHATSNHVACNWKPNASFCGVDGILLPEYVWAALDCPSGWSFLSAGDEVALLGEFSAEADAAVHCGQEYIVAGWEYERSGRKRLTGAAIYDADGTALAWSRATWITIDPGK